jgi:hypothetical protein
VPHVYDHGGVKPQRTALRDALVARLSLLKRPAMYLQAVVMLPTRINDPDDGTLYAALNGRAPAIAIALGRGEAAGGGMPASSARKNIEIAIYVVSSHGRGNVEGRLAGDVSSAADVTKDPGVETMLEHVEELLLGRDLGIPGVAEIRPGTEDEVWSGEDMTIWEATYTVRVDRAINHNRLVTTLLTEIDTRHEVDDADPDNPEAVNLTAIEAP